jgi:hypothetical protein
MDENGRAIDIKWFFDLVFMAGIGCRYCGNPLTHAPDVLTLTLPA